MKNISLVFAAVLFSGALAACGGGGGSSAGPGADITRPDPDIPRPELAPAGDIGLPRKGSVVQGTSTREENGVPNVTRNGIEVQVRSLNDFTIVNTGGVADWTLTEDDVHVSDHGAPLARSLTLDDRHDLYTTITVVVTTASPSRENVAEDIANGDWFAFGIWQNLSWSVDEQGRRDRFRPELGAFADGGNLVEHSINPGAGIAEYSGTTRGVFLDGEFAATVGVIQLTSNFITGKISGGITGFFANAGDDAKLILGEADIRQGFFRGDLSASSDTSDVSRYSGYWGGNFAGGDADDDAVVPSHVIGTFGGKAVRRFIGTFLAECSVNCD